MTKVAVITGANRGLGFATARGLGRSGAKVIVGARDGARGEEAAAALRSDGLDADSLALDVSSTASIQAAVKRVEQRHGRIDILVNNAGVLPEATAGDSDRPLDLRLFRETFETNLFGAVSVTKEFLPLLRRSDSGRIVNVSSMMGSLADQSDPASPYHGLVVPAYQTSKAAQRAHRGPRQGALRHADQGQLDLPRVGADGSGRPGQPRGGADDRERCGADRRRDGLDRTGWSNGRIRRPGRHRGLVTPRNALRSFYARVSRASPRRRATSLTQSAGRSGAAGRIR
jgi:NADP-dependent 3-hydroxy acid dehydrogenase YdfG